MESKIKKFDIKATLGKAIKPRNTFFESGYAWDNAFEKVEVLRKGVHVVYIERVAKGLGLPVSRMLKIIDMPQTTFNKKKRNNELLDTGDTEIIVLTSEVISFGENVFNNEQDKFHRWLQKKNTSLGNVSPQELLDTVTGINEVKNALNRLEYGNLA